MYLTIRPFHFIIPVHIPLHWLETPLQNSKVTYFNKYILDVDILSFDVIFACKQELDS